jgi:hypothetical protein
MPTLNAAALVELDDSIATFSPEAVEIFAMLNRIGNMKARSEESGNMEFEDFQLFDVRNSGRALCANSRTKRYASIGLFWGREHFAVERHKPVHSLTLFFFGL